MRNNKLPHDHGQNEEKILEILSAMQSDISGMKGDIAGLKEDVAGLKEDVAGLKEDMARVNKILEEHTEILEDHSVALNELLAWAEDVQVVVRIPFAQTKPIKPAEIKQAE